MQRAYAAGIMVPRLFAVGRFSIYMERLDGALLRDVRLTQGHMLKAGRMLRSLHMLDVSHGDFTTANIMLCGERLYVIDFGLSGISNNNEEKAIDLLLMKRAVEPGLYKHFISGYLGSATQERVLRRLEEIEKRGRYQVRTLGA